MAWLDREAIGGRKPLPKQVMLKDYLLDDLSSCSSNGFQSYPRRQQCCTTVRFLLEIDLKPRDSNRTKRIPKAKSTISVLQRASEAVANAVKLLPFSTAKSAPDQQQSKPKRTILPRSFSSKLLKRSFWKQTSSEIQRWKSFRELIEEEKSSDFSPSFATTTATTTTTTTLTTTSASNSWSDSDFTSDYSQCSTGNSENSCNDVAGDERRSPGKLVSERLGVTVGEDSVAATNATKEWPKEEKEQFSPVSILDCPFDDDHDDEDQEEEEEEEEVSSPFNSRLVRIQGSKQKLMQNIERFEKLAEIEPVDLVKQFSSSELSDEAPSTTTTQNEEDEEDKEEARALELLEQLKSTMPSTCTFKFQDDDLLLDFFKQKISEIGHKLDEEMYLNDAKDWVNGQPMEMYMDWVVPTNRHTYITDMEKGERWRLQKLDEDRQELAMELEVEVFDSLLDDLLLDLF